MVRARIREDEGLAAVCRRFWGRRWRPAVAVVSEMAGIGHGKRRSRAGLARVCGDVQLAGALAALADGRRQAGSGMARNRARARLNWVSQGQRCGRCSGEAACRAGEPSGQGEEPPSEGLGGH